MTKKNRRISLLVIRILLGFVFLLSGAGKLIDTGYVNYDLVRLLAEKFYWIIEYAAPVIITTSIIELILAIYLIWGKALKVAFTASLLMLIIFSSILSYFYFQGMSVASCGCFGAFGFASGLEFTLIRNAILIVLIIAGFILLNKKGTRG